MKSLVNSIRLAPIGLGDVTDRVLIGAENRDCLVRRSTINDPIIEFRISLGDDAIHSLPDELTLIETRSDYRDPGNASHHIRSNRSSLRSTNLGWPRLLFQRIL